MREIRTSGLMSGDGKRGGAQASVLAPILDSTHYRSVVGRARVVSGNAIYLPETPAHQAHESCQEGRRFL
jgi:hypothetical protein